MIRSRTAVLAPPTLLWSVLTCTLFALMTGVFARIAVPLPFTPVPFTLQPMAVMLTGLLLGSRLGAAAMLEYVVIGALGAPVFAGGTSGLVSAAMVTGSLGYLISYPFAAWLIGRLSERSTRSFWRLTLAGGAGLVVVYALGVMYLAYWLRFIHLTPGWQVIPQAIIQGTLPFILFDLAKAAVAAGIARKKIFE